MRALSKRTCIPNVGKKSKAFRTLVTQRLVSPLNICLVGNDPIHHNLIPYEFPHLESFEVFLIHIPMYLYFLREDFHPELLKPKDYLRNRKLLFYIY